jgi:hypothetical protein
MKLGLFVTNKDTKEPIEDLSSKNTNNYYDNVKYAKEDAQAVYEEAESEGLNVIVEIFETNPQGDKVGELIDTVDKIDKGEALEVDEEGDTQYATASSKVKGSKIEAKYYQDLSPDIQEAIHNGLYKQISEDLSGYFNESDITDMKNNPEKKDLFMEETIDNMINVSNDHNSIKEWVNEFYLNIEGSVKTKVKAEELSEMDKKAITAGEEYGKEISDEIRNKTREVIEGLKEEYEIDRAITPTFNLFINEVKNAVANMKS